MTYRANSDDDWEDDADAGDDFDDDLDDDLDGDSDDEPTVPCPSCGQEFLEDSPRCPYCERYISAEDLAGSQKPPWVIVTALACLGIAIWWIFR